MTGSAEGAVGAAGATADGGFASVACGVDGTREGFEAARQAARLTSADGRLLLIAVTSFYAALAGRWGPEASRWRMSRESERSVEECLADLRSRAEDTLAAAEAQTAGGARVSTRVVDGDADAVLLETAAAEGADLVVVGSHGGRRLTGVALGETTSMVLHESSVSVLVARAPFDPAGFPARIVAGFDGSPESRRALDAAARLRDRAGGRLTVVTASEDAVAAAPPEELTGSYDVLVSRDRAVDALVEAAQTADLLVVGSRGMHGARSLGSVSERVAHRASSSVLVVRAPAGT